MASVGIRLFTVQCISTLLMLKTWLLILQVQSLVFQMTNYAMMLTHQLPLTMYIANRLSD